MPERMKTLVNGVLLAGLMAPVVAMACPCLALEADGFDRANEVFTGVVLTTVEIGSNHQRTTFRIESLEKGSATGEFAVVSENRRDTGCSAQFKVGDTYKVYTHDWSYLDLTTFKNIEVPNYTSACSRKPLR